MRHASIHAEIGGARDTRPPQGPRTECPDGRRLARTQPARGKHHRRSTHPRSHNRPARRRQPGRGARDHHVGDANRARNCACRPNQLDDGRRATQATNQKRRAPLDPHRQICATPRDCPAAGREWVARSLASRLHLSMGGGLVDRIDPHDRRTKACRVSCHRVQVLWTARQSLATPTARHPLRPPDDPPEPTTDGPPMTRTGLSNSK